MKLCYIALFWVFGSTSAIAADPERVERYLELAQIERSFEQLPKVMQASAEQSVAQVAQLNGMNEEQTAQARELALVQVAAMAELLSWEALKDEYVKLFAETLTDAEVEAAIIYMSSAEAQSIIAKQPMLMQKSAEISQRRMAEIMPALQAEIRTVMEQFKQKKQD